MPVISPGVVSRATGRENFRDEWGWAIERLGKYTGLDLPFIVPVVIDDTPAGAGPGHPGGIHPQAGRECARWESDR